MTPSALSHMGFSVMRMTDKSTWRGSGVVPHLQTEKKDNAEKDRPNTLKNWSSGIADAQADGCREAKTKTRHVCFELDCDYFACPVSLSSNDCGVCWLAECAARWVAATWSWTAAANKGLWIAPLHLCGAWAAGAFPLPPLTVSLLTQVGLTVLSLRL